MTDNNDYHNKTNHWTARYKLAVTNVILNLFKISSSEVSGKMIYCSVSVTWIWIYDDYLLHEITNSIKIVLSRKKAWFSFILASENSFLFLQINIFENSFSSEHHSRAQCPRTNLNKRFLPRPKTITAWKLIPHRSKISKNWNPPHWVPPHSGTT